jgi:hypothetical protein
MNMRAMLFAIALTGMAGAADAAPALVQPVDWYCGPHCQRHRYWEHRRWQEERWRESQAWRHHYHPDYSYPHHYPNYYGYNRY